MNIKHITFAAITVFALNHIAGAQNIIGVGVPTGSTRNDTYVGAGFEFYAPASVGTTINALGFWDANGTGLLEAHQVSIFKYAGIGSSYDLVVTATIPAGTVAPFINGYRWVGIPTQALPDNGQGGGYYCIMATQGQDTWANNINPAPYLNPQIGTVSGYGILASDDGYTVLESPVNIHGTGNPGDGFGGANLAFLTPQPPTQPEATPILWSGHGSFSDDTVLSVAGTPANEVYGVDFGGSGSLTTANGYSFADYGDGNVTLAGNAQSYNAYLSGGGTTGDANFDAVLNSGIYDGGGGVIATLNNLTVGQRYNVLAVEADTRGSTATFAFTDYLSVSPFQTLAFPGGTPAIGGYVMGTFTATATSQVFTVFSSQIQYNGILVETILSTAITLVEPTTPASPSVGSGTNVTFTAAFSNNPAVNLQWEQVIFGTPDVTNNINTGVVNVTNNGVVTSTLTLSNVQASNSASYQLQATAVNNSANVAYSGLANLTVIPLITWYAAGTYNGTFSDNTVLAYAGSTANEVYGVDFGGSGAQTTGNGYTFNDYEATGNMSVAGGPSSYGGYMVGGATTGDLALDTLLAFGVYGGTQNTGTLNNLTVGQSYTVLVLLDDTRGPAAGGSVFYVTDGVSVSPGQQYAFANGSPKVGGYIMGTFTAQETTQPLTILNVIGGASQYNAVLLETGIAPPPPLPPALTSDVTPLLSDVPVGALMSFSVAATGALPLTYQWSNQNGPINGATNSSYSFSASAGTNSYYVSVRNAVNTIASSTAVVVGETTAPPLVAFNGGTGWSINDNGNVTPGFTGNLLELTDGNGSESGSSFYNAGQYVGGFVASFIYQTPSDGGADGITFCMQNSPEGTNALGAPGGDLGYTGITPSAAFEMNLYVNAVHGGVGILLETNGIVSSFGNSGYTSTAPVNIASGDNIYVRLYYLHGVMNVLLVDPSVPATYTTSYSINLPAVVGNGSAYIGFTGSDGGVSSIQTVSNLLYSYTTPPIISVAPGASGKVVVSWPVSVSSLFQLVQSDSITGPWSSTAPSTVSSTVAGLQNVVTLTPLGAATFYELQLIDPNAP
jgi:hypothetical protein